MALIKYIEFGKQIINNAKTCPNYGAKAKKRTSTSAGIILIIALLFACFSCTDTKSVKSSRKVKNYQNQQLKKPESTSNQISLQKGIIKINGYAFIDGRDLQAISPSTISRINIWNSYNRSRVVCKLAHGTKVKILDAKYISKESRYYLKVQTEYCEGWISDPFISSEKMKPVGDVF